MTRSLVRRWGGAYVSLVVFWAALVGVSDPLELAVGAGAAAAATLVFAIVLTRGRFPSLVFRRRTWTRATDALARIPTDLLLLPRAFRARGSRSTISLPAGTDWRHRAERGSAELFGSLAPNTIVYEVSNDGRAEVHELVRSGR